MTIQFFGLLTLWEISVDPIYKFLFIILTEINDGKKELTPTLDISTEDINHLIQTKKAQLT